MNLPEQDGSLADKRRTRSFLAHVPAPIDFAAVCGKPNWIDFGLWAVGAIIFQRFRIHKLTPTDWCPLAAEFVRSFIPSRVWPTLRDRLVGAGVLEWDRFYRPSTPDNLGKSYCFRIGSEYRESPLVARPLTKSSLVNRIVSYRRRERGAVTDPVHVQLRRRVEKLRVLNDAPYGDPVLDRIRSGDCWFAVDDMGRIHTPATNVARIHRQYLHLCGRKLTNVDVVCSQPTLLAVTLLEGLRGAEGGGAKDHAFSCAFMLEDEFLKDCKEGRVYTRLAEAFGGSRDEAKVGLFEVVYGAPLKHDRPKAERFASLYPSTWETILRVSRHLYGNETAFKKGGELAREMQRVESRLMIGGVAARFLRESPETPVLTCHDALLVPEEGAGLAADLIRDEWYYRHGIVPQVRIGPWVKPSGVELPLGDRF